MAGGRRRSGAGRGLDLRLSGVAGLLVGGHGWPVASGGLESGRVPASGVPGSIRDTTRPWSRACGWRRGPAGGLEVDHKEVGGGMGCR